MKEAKTGETARISDEDMGLINEFSKKKLTNDEVFTFEILLCDNDVDRDCERFSNGALAGLAEMFKGKTGIFDHEWTAGGQVARIYKTQVVSEKGRSTVTGEPYCYLKAWAYMLREGNGELIAEIEGGIKREVSIGCSMGKAVCSICGEEMGSQKCGHTRGGEYGGKTCHAVLSEPRDAYEWSFVAVPAQKNAGVLKKFAAGECGKKIADGACGQMSEAEDTELKELAELGRKYLAGLREEVVRLGVLSQSGFDGDFLRGMAKKLNEEELKSFKKAFERRADELYPSECQLGRSKAESLPSVGEFLI